MPSPRTSRLAQLKRGAQLVLKLFEGLLLIGAVFTHIRPSERDVIIERWCREVLDVLSIRLNLRGETPPGSVVRPVSAITFHGWTFSSSTPVGVCVVWPRRRCGNGRW
jgi:hypothetical protein